MNGRPALVIATALLALACNSTESLPPTAPTASAQPAPSAAPSDASSPIADAAAPIPAPSAAPVVIKLERTPCLGTCPIYTVVIRADATWTFSEFYPKKGCVSSSMPRASLDALLATAKSMGYFALKDSYTVRVTDLPSADTQVTLDGKTKKVHHYGIGADPAEKSLTAFERDIDTAVDIKGLLSGYLELCGAYGAYPGVP